MRGTQAIFPPCLAAMALLVVGCGGSTQRQLVSMNLTPAVGNAQSSADGQVQFSATGNYNQPPLAAPIEPALWGIYLPQDPQSKSPSINQSGLAECGTASGTFSITAYAVANPATPQTEQNLLSAQKVVLGTAELVCP